MDRNVHQGLWSPNYYSGVVLGLRWLFCLHTRSCTFSCPANCTLRQNYRARGKPVLGPNEDYSLPPGLLNLLHKEHQLCGVDDKSWMQNPMWCCTHSVRTEGWNFPSFKVVSLFLIMFSDSPENNNKAGRKQVLAPWGELPTSWEPHPRITQTCYSWSSLGKATFYGLMEIPNEFAHSCDHLGWQGESVECFHTRCWLLPMECMLASTYAKPTGKHTLLICDSIQTTPHSPFPCGDKGADEEKEKEKNSFNLSFFHQGEGGFQSNPKLLMHFFEGKRGPLPNPKVVKHYLLQKIKKIWGGGVGHVLEETQIKAAYF